MEQWREDVLVHYGIKGMKWGNHIRSALYTARINRIANKRRYSNDVERNARAYEASKRRATAMNSDYGYNKDTGFHTERAPKSVPSNMKTSDPRYRLARGAAVKSKQKSEADLARARKNIVKAEKASLKSQRNLWSSLGNDRAEKNKSSSRKAMDKIKKYLNKFKR